MPTRPQRLGGPGGRAYGLRVLRLLAPVGFALLLALPAPPPAAASWRWPVHGHILGAFRTGPDPFAPGQNRDDVVDVLTADQRMLNLPQIASALRAVTSHADFRYPGVGTAARPAEVERATASLDYGTRAATDRDVPPRRR